LLSCALFGTFIVGFIFVKAFFPTYWHLETPQLSAHTPVGVTENGHPWIGAEKPELTITEFADYQCFQCKKMHFFLRQLVAKHPDKIRLIHRHFPMDHQFNPLVKEPFHVGSARMALLAIYAATRDKFWEMNDVLFDHAGEKGALNVKALADEVGLNYEDLGRAINDPAIRLKLQRDIINGLKLNISGTPAFVINDEVYLAQIPAEVIKDAFKE
jgi:protein-disulfide isomerase